MYVVVAAVVEKWQMWHFRFYWYICKVWWKLGNMTRFYCKFRAESKSEIILKSVNVRGSYARM